MEDAPEGVLSDVEVQPGSTAGGVIKVPGIDGVRTLHQLVDRVPAPGVGHAVAEGFVELREEVFHPGIIAGRLPGDVSGFYKAVFNVGFDLHAHPLFPVFAFARLGFGRGGHVVEDASVDGLRSSECFDRALKVREKVAGTAGDILVVADPEAFAVRTPKSGNRSTVEREVDEVGLEKIVNLRGKPPPGGIGSMKSEHKKEA